MVQRYEMWGNKGKKEKRNGEEERSRAQRKARGEWNNAFSLYFCCFFFFFSFSSTTADVTRVPPSISWSTSLSASSPICSRNAEHSRSPGMHVVVARGYHCPARARSRVRDSIPSVSLPFLFACHSGNTGNRPIIPASGMLRQETLTNLSSLYVYAFWYNER